MKELSLVVLKETYAVARLGPDAAVPPWAADGELASVTRTEDELSIVCPAAAVPPDVEAERDWRCLKVEGPLDFSEIGILAALASSLARAELSIFALSTYDTDYLLVRADRLDRAVAALRSEGHLVAV